VLCEALSPTHSVTAHDVVQAHTLVILTAPGPPAGCVGEHEGEHVPGNAVSNSDGEGVCVGHSIIVAWIGRITALTSPPYVTIMSQWPSQDRPSQEAAYSLPTLVTSYGVAHATGHPRCPPVAGYRNDTNESTKRTFQTYRFEHLFDACVCN